MTTEYSLPPNNIEAEKGVISGALMDNETIWIFDGFYNYLQYNVRC
jgi:hypothetical protein